MQVKIKRIEKDLPLPEYKTTGAAAFDIYTRLDATIPPRSFVALPTNLIIAIPEGYMLMIAARSSSAKKKGLTMRNGAAIIDSDFCGPEDELQILVQNLDDEPKIVERGERLAQGVFLPIQKGEWTEVEEMTAQTRGGFGSTGL